eukprot:gene10291-biopygen12298
MGPIDGTHGCAQKTDNNQWDGDKCYDCWVIVRTIRCDPLLQAKQSKPEQWLNVMPLCNSQHALKAPQATALSIVHPSAWVASVRAGHFIKSDEGRLQHHIFLPRRWHSCGVHFGYFLLAFVDAQTPAIGRLGSHLESILHLFCEHFWRPRPLNWTQSTDAQKHNAWKESHGWCTDVSTNEYM